MRRGDKPDNTGTVGDMTEERDSAQLDEATYMRQAAARAFEALSRSADDQAMAEAMEMCVRFFPIESIDTEAMASADVRGDAERVRDLLESANGDDEIEDAVDDLWEGIVAAERAKAARGYAMCAVLLETVIEPILDETLREMSAEEAAGLAGMSEEDLRGELLSRSRRAQTILFGV